MDRTVAGPTDRVSASRRVASAAGLLLFVGAFFALPLFAALSICTMPCCHRAPVAGVGAPMSAMPCGTSGDCFVRDDEIRSAASVTIPQAPSTPLHLLPRTVATPTAPAAIDLATAGGAPPGAHAPLNLLHSVFRI